MEDLQFIDDPGGMNALFREAQAKASEQLQREFYVALNLEQLPAGNARALAAAHSSSEMPEAVMHEGTAFYHLTPMLFAWLHSRMRQARAAHKAGKLPETSWATARMLWSEILDKANRAFGRSVLEEAVKSFRPGRYKLPEPPREKQFTGEDIPASCPYSREYLERAAREHPNIIPCPKTKSPWWWVEKAWCETKCQGHPQCIRHLYWISSAPAEGGQE